jgi:tetratricopeptide (TPR) repeat protein
MNKIFISYSRKDKEWVSEWLVPRLEGAGVEVCIDFRNFKIGGVSLHNMRDAVKECQWTILVITQNWIESEWTKFEALILQTQDPLNLKGRMLPLMLEKCSLPEELSIFTYADFREKNNRETELNRLLEQLKLKVEKDKPGPDGPTTSLAPERISTFKLPTTGPHLFGRDRELKALDKAWNDGEIDVVTLVAWGGVGKTALVNHWLNTMRKENYKGARKVYAWSFYSQGAEEGKQASADEFMQETLQWFGDNDPTLDSAVEKGRRLARLVKKQRTLLILDGMEPLQYPPGEVHGFDGKLKDPGMRAFLRELSAGHPGLCAVTSREKVTNLEDRTTFSVKEMELDHLSKEAGAELLKRLGVIGTDKDILKAAEEYDGHALALTLLGQFIRSAYKGDIRKRDKIPRLTKERIQGGHARRIMEAYEQWLGASAERDILYIMGLFDRPAEGGAIEALKAEPPIPGVTDQLVQLSEEDWNNALFNLMNARLLAEENPKKPDALDCHPLIREHFGEKLKKKNEKGWKEAHKRLYNYFKNLPEKELPDTLQEMEPLFAAVAHGCRAGLHHDVEVEIFFNRIRRKNEAYTTHKLGAFGSDIAALSNFYEIPWSKPVDDLPDDKKAVILSWSAFDLRAVGRLREAIQPMKACLELVIKQKNWENAAIGANNLSELILTLGEVSHAVVYARQSVTIADRGGNAFWKEASKTTLADALHQEGQIKESGKWFREAESKQKERHPSYSYLYGLAGYQFCDLLLGGAAYQEVMKRAENTIEIAKQQFGLLDVALDNLTLGRAWMMQIQEERNRDFGRAMEFLDRAVQGLRDAGTQHRLPLGLLARAACFRIQGQFSRAWDDLNEAKEIAEAGDMKLHLVDYHLEAGRVSADEGKDEEAKSHFKVARKMIEETGYHRRDEEIMNFE